MAKAKSAPPAALTTFDILGMRLQATINSPKAQKAHTALLERRQDDRPEDWERILEAISENDNVTVAHRDDGNIQVFWTNPPQD